MNVNLKELAEFAIHQIKDKKYANELKGEIVMIGLAYCRKDVEIV